VKVTIDVDNGAAGHDLNFYTSTDATAEYTEVSWTKLGDTVTVAGTTSFANSANTLDVGAQTSGAVQRYVGNIFRAVLLDGVDGTEVADMDARNQTNDANGDTSTFSSGGVTWTQNDCFIQNTGFTVAHSIGSWGLETTAGQTISSPFTVAMVGRHSNTPSADAYMFAPRSSTTAWASIHTNNGASDQFVISQDDGTEVGALAFDNSPHVFIGQFNGDATTKLTVSDVGSATGNAGGDDWDFASLFVDEAGSNTMQGYIARLLVFDRALSERDVSILNNHLRSQYGV